MKTIYHFLLLLGLLCGAIGAKAQIAQPSLAPDPSYRYSEYRTTADQTLQNLDINPVRSKVLYDRVFPAAQLSNWTQSDQSSQGHFTQAQRELYEASYNAFDKLRPDDFHWLVEKSLHEQVIPVGVIVSTFQMLNHDALEEDANNRLRLKAGYNINQAYQTKQAAVAALLAPALRQGTYTFKLADWATSVQYGNCEDIARVAVNFGDGNGYRNMNSNGTVEGSFYGLGTKIIDFDIHMTNGDILKARSTVEITSEGCTDCSSYIDIQPSSPAARIARTPAYPTSDGISKIDFELIEADIAFQGYDEFIDSRGKGEVLTYYARGREQVRRPIIILDGFDPGDDRSAVEIYEDKLSYDRLPNNNALLGDDLRENDPGNDFDVIILNFPKYEYNCYNITKCSRYDLDGNCCPGKTYTVPVCKTRDGGADYIERNAFVLVKLIQQVNQKLQANGSNEKIVIVGPSMGGLISRIALREMEQRGMDANCKLWVSMDSPHHGVNIPIGAQMFLYNAATKQGLQSAQDALDEQFDNPAARQLLIHHYRGYLSGPGGQSPTGAPGFRDRFQNMLYSTGFPQASCLRRVAIANGSKDGTLQPFSDCREALRVDGQLVSSGFGTVCFLGGAVISIFFPGVGTGVAVLCLAASAANVQYRAYSAPNNTELCEITNGRTARGWRQGQPSIDLLPGGYFDVFKVVADRARNKKWFKRIEATPYFSQPAFIPTVSAYAMNNPDRNWGASLVGIDAPNETPFAAVEAPSGKNEDHVTLTNANIAFVRTQLALANSQQCGGTNPSCGNGQGLTTKYYNNENLQGNPVASFNGNIDLIGDQNGNLPNSGQQAQNVSARWEGQIEAPVSGSYTFNVRTDDGVRVWLDNQQRVDDFGYYPPKDHNFTVNLSAGQKYNLKVEWKQGGGGFEAKMFWSYPGQGNQIVPACWLFPASGGGGCNTPTPSLAANPATINSGQSSTLNASGCSGTVNWSNGLGTGNSKSVSPGSTTTYSATCTANGCTSGNASVTVTVNGTPPPSLCAEAESSNGNGPITSDPNASNGGTRGAENNYNHYVDYQVSVPSAGSYTLTLQYYATGTANVNVAVTQGGNGSVSVNLPSSGSWNIVHTTATVTVNLAAGSNTIRIQGTGGSSCRQDKICVTGGSGGCSPPNPPSVSANPTTINTGGSTQLSASGCSGTVTWSNGAGTGNSVTAYPSGTTTYTATCTVSGCTSSASNGVTVTVNGGGGGSSCHNLSDLCSGNQNEIRSYTMSLSSGGSKALTLTYRSHNEPGTGRIRINGGGWQQFALPQTPGDLSYLTTGIGTYAMNSGNNTVELASVNGGYVCFRELCASSGGARLGVAEEPAIEKAELIVSPNPNDGEFEARFYVEPGRKATLRVSDVLGRQVWQKSLTGRGEHRETVRLPAQSVGSYILLLDKEATAASGKTEFKRVIVVK